jgi:plasmid stabilization system protein ParE
VPSEPTRSTTKPVEWKLLPRNRSADALDDGDGAFYPQLAVYDGRLYNTWYERVEGVLRIRVAVLDSRGADSVWRFVDEGSQNGLNRDASKDARWSRLLVHDHELYAYWHEDTDAERRTIRVSRYNGNDEDPQWTYIDGTRTNGLRIETAESSAEYASLASFGGRLYAAWRSSEGAAYQIRVARFEDGIGGSGWTLVDRHHAGINRDTTMDGYYPKLHVHQKRLYAAWYERNGASRQLRVAVFHGAGDAPRWSLVDGDDRQGLNYRSDSGARGPQLLSHGGRLYAIWHERMANGASYVRVSRYNGEDDEPDWHFVDGGGASGLNWGEGTRGWWARAASTEEGLFVAWSENDAGTYRIRVSTAQLAAMTHGARSWRAATDSNGLNVSAMANAEYPHLVTWDGQLIASWSEMVDGVLRVFVAQGTVR